MAYFSNRHAWPSVTWHGSHPGADPTTQKNTSVGSWRKQARWMMNSIFALTPHVPSGGFTTE